MESIELDTQIVEATFLTHNPTTAQFIFAKFAFARLLALPGRATLSSGPMRSKLQTQ